MYRYICRPSSSTFSTTRRIHREQLRKNVVGKRKQNKKLPRRQGTLPLGTASQCNSGKARSLLERKGAEITETGIVPNSPKASSIRTIRQSHLVGPRYDWWNSSSSRRRRVLPLQFLEKGNFFSRVGFLIPENRATSFCLRFRGGKLSFARRNLFFSGMYARVLQSFYLVSQYGRRAIGNPRSP